MTAIVPSFIKTKKQLKAHLAEGAYLSLRDPMPWGEDNIRLNVVDDVDGSFTHEALHNGRGTERLKPGFSFTCTNHPRRSWFATIKVQPDSTLKVT